MGRGLAPVQRPAHRRLSRFLALLRPPFRFGDRHFSGTETRHSAIAIASGGSDCANEGAEDQSHHCRAVHDRKIAERVASATGAKVVDFAQYPGALPGTDTYIKLIDALVSRLAAALK